MDSVAKILPICLRWAPASQYRGQSLLRNLSRPHHQRPPLQRGPGDQGLRLPCCAQPCWCGVEADQQPYNARLCHASPLIGFSLSRLLFLQKLGLIRGDLWDLFQTRRGQKVASGRKARKLRAGLFQMAAWVRDTVRGGQSRWWKALEQRQQRLHVLTLLCSLVNNCCSENHPCACLPPAYSAPSLLLRPSRGCFDFLGSRLNYG